MNAPIEAHAYYTVKEVAAHFKLSSNYVRNMFKETQGILAPPSIPKKPGTRPRQTIRIPGAAVLEMVRRWEQRGFVQQVQKGRRAR